MAISQPSSGDKQNNPDHSLIHRQIATDLSAPVKSITVNSDGTTTIQYGYISNVTTVIDTYQVLVTDELIVCNKPTAFTVTLPIATVGQRFWIKNIGVGAVTLEGLNTDTIDNDLNQEINQWECIVVQCSVANTWLII